MVKKKKRSKKKYDYKKIAKQTKGQVRDSSERKGISGGGIFKSGISLNKFTPVVDEDHTVDIIPFQAGDNMSLDMKTGEPMAKEDDWGYTYEYHQHRGVGPLENETVICLERTFKKPCPICEHRKELIAEKTFDSEKMGELLCKRRNLYNIVCYDTDKEEEKGVQLMDVSNFYFEKHISKLASKVVRRKRGSKLKSADPFKNFADPSENGVSIEFSIEGAKTKNDFDSWMGHQLIERDYDLDQELLKTALQLDQIVEVLTYEELYKLYYDEDYEGEPDEDEVAGEEEPEEEEEDLDDMTRKELKAYIKENDLDVSVTKGMDDEDIVTAIQNEIDDNKGNTDEEEEEEEEEEEKPKRRSRRGSKKKKRVKKNECPEGGVFGEDFEEFDACDNCKNWDACEEKANEDEDDDD